MSIPDHELEPRGDEYCERHEHWYYADLDCLECYWENLDLYTDAARDDAWERAHWLIAFLICLVTLATPLHTQAELYVFGNMGQSRFSETNPDGTWRQEGLPDQHFERQALSLSAGLGYRWSPNWSVEASYVSFGASETSGQKVEDVDYDPAAHRILPGHEYAQRSAWSGRNSLTGGSVALRYTYPVPSLYLAPYARVGVWGAYSRHTVVDHRFDPAFGFTTPRDVTVSFPGLVGGVAVGGGLCTATRLAICGRVDYYHGVYRTGFPHSTRVMVPSVGLEWTF